jgi:carboxypeptidase T
MRIRALVVSLALVPCAFPDAAFAQAVPPGYSDLNGVLLRMQEIAAAHPEIAQYVDITDTYDAPPTVEGRHLFALKISDNVAADEDEPAMLIVATHHAREISTPEIALQAAGRLTAGYGTDARITAAVDGHEIWIAPVWNPDGYDFVFTAQNMWRKNRRPFASGTGVDQNRNYPQGWTASCAGSTSASSDTYKGPSAASEAETQTMMIWSQAERFAKVIDYHSSGREVLYGYRCLSHPFTSWMRQEAVNLSRASGYGGLVRLPSAEGEHPEWQFAKMGAYAFLIETHTQFQPSYASALNEAALVWPGILTVLERPIPVSGRVTDALTGAPIAARIDLVNVTFANGETNNSGGSFGGYHVFVPPGTYDIRFSASGYAPVVRRVTVSSTIPSNVVDVQLSPPVPEEVVFADDFETETGWTRNPDATDNASLGLWERGDPQSTSSEGTKQLGTTVSGVNDLSTGRLAGSSAGANDVDGGRTSIQSPIVTLPASGTLTLSFSYYFAHGSNSSTADFLRVSIVAGGKTTVFQELGAANDDDAAWAAASVDLTAFAGQAIRILIEAADAGGASLVEAAIDDVRIVRQ